MIDDTAYGRLHFEIMFFRFARTLYAERSQRHIGELDNLFSLSFHDNAPFNRLVEKSRIVDQQRTSSNRCSDLRSSEIGSRKHPQRRVAREIIRRERITENLKGINLNDLRLRWTTEVLICKENLVKVFGQRDWTVSEIVNPGALAHDRICQKVQHIAQANGY